MLYKLILSLAEINPQTHTHTKRGEREHTPNQPGDTKLTTLLSSVRGMSQSLQEDRAIV